MLAKDIQQLGFSESEAKVYLALLEVGFCTTGPIIKKTGLHRNIVYETLDKLVAQGLASQSTQKGKKHFRALSPEKILAKEKDRFELAKQIVPKLSQMQKEPGQEIAVYEGQIGFQNAHFDALEQMKKNSEIQALIPGAEKWYENMSSVLKKFDRKRIEKNIAVKIAALQNQKEAMEKQKKRPLLETRFLSETFNNPANTVVYGESTLIIVYGQPIFVIMIKNPQVAESYRQYFQLFWKMAEK